MITHIKGNLLDSDCDYICHQVNCHGVMGSGIEKQIKEKWPNVYAEYRNRYEYYVKAGISIYDLLGDTDLIFIGDENKDRFVINMYSQGDYGYIDKRYTSYDAFSQCLELIDCHVPLGSKIGFPKNIGCGLGGGNWNIIYALIEEILGDTHDVYIYEYEP